MHHRRRGWGFSLLELGGFAEREGGRGEGVGGGIFGSEELAGAGGGGLEGGEAGRAVAEEEVEEEDAEDGGEDVGDGAVAPQLAGGGHVGYSSSPPTLHLNS